MAPNGKESLRTCRPLPSPALPGRREHSARSCVRRVTVLLPPCSAGWRGGSIPVCFLPPWASSLFITSPWLCSLCWSVGRKLQQTLPGAGRQARGASGDPGLTREPCSGPRVGHTDAVPEKPQSSCLDDQNQSLLLSKCLSRRSSVPAITPPDASWGLSKRGAPGTSFEWAGVSPLWARGHTMSLWGPLVSESPPFSSLLLSVLKFWLASRSAMQRRGQHGRSCPPAARASGTAWRAVKPGNSWQAG